MHQCGRLHIPKAAVVVFSLQLALAVELSYDQRHVSRILMWKFLFKFLSREMGCSSCPFLHPAASNTDVMARALAAFLGHEDLRWGKALTNTRNPEAMKEKMNIFD